MDAIYTAAAGLKTSAYQFDSAAQRVVRASVPQTGAATGLEAAARQSDDLPAAIADTQTAEFAFKANTAVLKTADKMIGSLLDILV